MADIFNSPFSPGQSKRRKISDILQDPSFNQGDAGPGIEDDEAAFNRFFAAGEGQRRREEGAATDQVLEGLQSRGLARSGIAIKDVISKVLGPSFERSERLASEGALEQARRRSDLLEAQRGRAGSLNQARLGGRISSILQQDQGDIGMDQAILDLIAGREAGAAADRRASMDRRAARQNAVVGGIAGIVGSLCFSPETMIRMGDGTEKRIDQLDLGEMTEGGKVLSIRIARAQDMGEYAGVSVTAKHAIRENGSWIRVEDSKSYMAIEGEFDIVSLITSKHRIFINGRDGVIEFADEIEVDGGDQMTNEESLAALNAQG